MFNIYILRKHFFWKTNFYIFYFIPRDKTIENSDNHNQEPDNWENFVGEDYAKDIFESKFIFSPDKELASSCGCGVSFSPKMK